MISTYPPQPNAVSIQKLGLIDMLKLLEKDVRKTEKASEKFKATCERLGFFTEDNF